MRKGAKPFSSVQGCEVTFRICFRAAFGVYRLAKVCSVPVVYSVIILSTGTPLYGTRCVIRMVMGNSNASTRSRRYGMRIPNPGDNDTLTFRGHARIGIPVF